MKAQQKEDQKFKLYWLAQIKHYRVDKMLKIQMSEEEREGKEWFRKLDMADYAKKSFGMFGGKEQEEVVEEMRQEVKRLMRQYHIEE